MILIDELVEHKIFGTGQIVSQDMDMVYIQFNGNIEIKRFMYPDAFEKYLKMCDSMVEAEVLKDLNIKMAQIEAERLEKQLLYDEEAKRKAMEKLELASQKKKKTKSTKSKNSSQASI